MPIPLGRFTVHLYRNDNKMMHAEVLRHEEIETGGSLFGLWTTSGNVVVHAVLGPGQNCRRTNVSFHQDIQYLERKGRFLNDKFMLCHIGEWHSHHRLRLNEPSYGDMRTVRNNYPEGMQRFLMIICNIVDGGQVVLSPYFFTNNGKGCEKGSLQVLQVDSPFSGNVAIARELEQGREKIDCGAPQGTPARNSEHAPSRMLGGNVARGGSRDGNSIQAPGGGRHAAPDASDGSSSYRYCPEGGTPSSGDRNVSDPSAMDVDPRPPSYTDALLSPHRGGNGPATENTRAGESFQTVFALPPRDYDLPPSNNEHLSRQQKTTPCRQNSDHGFSHGSVASSPPPEDERPATQREIVLKKVHDELKTRFGNEADASFRFEGARFGDIEIKFKHKDRYWLVSFPENFPEKPAKLYCCYIESSLRSSESPYYNIEKPLNNHINILLSIKNNCSSSCSSCKKINKDGLSQSNSPSSSPFNVDYRSSFMALVNEIEVLLADRGTLRSESFARSREGIITFMHGYRSWTIRLPFDFPQKEATVFFGNDISVLLFQNYSHDLVPLDSSSKIISAIRKKCRCMKCANSRR